MVLSDNCALVTTSWDDGHHFDLRVAKSLAKRGLYGTFYVPIHYTRVPRMDIFGIRELRAMGMEVGAHTVNHVPLTHLGEAEARRELIDGREILEQILEERVVSFCYPEGKFRRRDRELVRQCGYRVARTTVTFQSSLNFDPYAMPVGFQVYPHARTILARHALKEGNLSGLASWIWNLSSKKNLVSLAESMLAKISKCGGVLHIWGHSWEIDGAGLWPKLDAVLDVIANRRDVTYTTNAGVLNAAARSSVPMRKSAIA